MGFLTQARMTNEARTELPEHYNVPGQRRGYTSCTASSSDEGSSNLVSPDLEEEVAVVGEPQDTTLVDESDCEENDPMDTIKRAVKAAPSRPPRVIDSLPASGSSTVASTEYYNLCHPPPLDNPVPTIPRRKPYISNPDLGGTQYGPQRSTASTWSERSCQPRYDEESILKSPHQRCAVIQSCYDALIPSFPFRSRCASQSSTATDVRGGIRSSKRRGVASRRRKGSTCHCKNSGQ